MTQEDLAIPVDSPTSPTPARSWPQVRAVLFDFDLTLADSTAAVVECCNYALAALGFAPLDTERVRGTIGLTLPLTFRALAGVTDAGLESEFSRLFVQRADEVMVSWIRLYASVPAMLQRLRECGVRTAIVSTKFRYRIESILTEGGLAGAVDVIVGGEDVKEHKPHPAGLIHALAQLGVSASEAIYVGDHSIDAEAATRAGMRFVAVRTGVAQADAWSACNPLEVIDNAGELVRFFA